EQYKDRSRPLCRHPARVSSMTIPDQKRGERAGRPLPTVPWITRGLIGSRPSRCSFLRASLRARRTGSAFSRTLFSGGLSQCLRSLISWKPHSRCILFFNALRAWSTVLSRTKTCTRYSFRFERPGDGYGRFRIRWQLWYEYRVGGTTELAVVTSSRSRGRRRS